jgi:hypothetical protein
MVSMNPRLVVLLLFASLLPAVQAKAKTILPDACGDDSVKFDVKTKKDQPPLAPPEAGKAQIVFVGTIPYESIMVSWPAVRYGVDGAWAGANKGNTYFVLNVNPGVHNLCVALQDPPYGMSKSVVDMASFTAEAGKVYFYEARFGVVKAGGAINAFGLYPLEEAEGKYRVKAWKLSISKVHEDVPNPLY